MPRTTCGDREDCKALGADGGQNAQPAGAEGGVGSQDGLLRLYLDPQKYAKPWAFGLFLDVLGHYFTYVWHPGKAIQG